MAVPPFTIQPASPHFIKCGEDAIWRSLNWANVADHHLMTQIRGNPANHSTFIRYDQNHIDHHLVMHIDHQILVILHLTTQICSYIKTNMWSNLRFVVNSMGGFIQLAKQNLAIWNLEMFCLHIHRGSVVSGGFPIIEHISLKPCISSILSLSDQNRAKYQVDFHDFAVSHLRHLHHHQQPNVSTQSYWALESSLQ